MTEYLRLVRSEETEAIIQGLQPNKPPVEILAALGQAGLSKAHFAEVCQVEESDVASWENGGEIPHAPSLILQDVRSVMHILIEEAALEPSQAWEFLTKEFGKPEENGERWFEEGERPIDAIRVDPLRALAYAEGRVIPSLRSQFLN